MITTNNKKLSRKLRILRTHGITKSKKKFQNQLNVANGLNQKESITYPKWYMEMQTLGYNYRITEIQAALGISQLKRAKAGVIKRRKIAKYYYNFFKGKAYIINQSGLVEGHAYHLYVIEVKNRLSLYNHFIENKIYAQIHYFPCHLMPYYRSLGYSYGLFSNIGKLL